MKKLVTTIALLATALLLGAGTLAADDRDLLRTSSGNPYVFIVFDTSGSMNWTPPCTQAQVNAGICTYLCPNGDCLPRRMADDPDSKFAQAKEALYQVINTTQNINFGFATYNQDQLTVDSKHWLYRMRIDGPELRNSDGTVVLGRFPVAGTEVTFGRSFTCDNAGNANTQRDNSDDLEVGCYPTSEDAARINNAWDVQRVVRHPKLGTNGLGTTRNFVQTSNGDIFRIDWSPVAGYTYGDAEFRATVTASRCSNGCATLSQTNFVEVIFDSPRDFLNWEAGTPSRTGNAFFRDGQNDHSATNVCAGWDPNTDPNIDSNVEINADNDVNADGFSLRFPTTNVTDPREPPGNKKMFRYGDVLPLDWQNDNRSGVLARLAPNGTNFGQASYLRDSTNPGKNSLELKDLAFRPLIADGSTPLGHTIGSFRTWYAGCLHGACPHDTGWKDVAARLDPDWACRRKYLLVITDGDDTCAGADACSFTASLRANEDILTYVVAFGLQNSSGNRLNCMAANGGTGDPIYPQNKAQLVAALTSIFGQIQEETRAFASAAVPSVQADVSDKIYISRFIPLNDESIWPGSLDGYIKPIPLNDDGRPGLPADQPPNPDLPCDADTESSCYLWDVGQVLLGQAATPAQIAANNYNMSQTQANARRVFYPLAHDPNARPGRMRAFVPPSGAPAACAGYPLLTGCSAWWDLFYGFGLDALANPTAAQTTTTNLIGETLVRKTAVQDTPTGPVSIDFILGDLFHSDPLYVERPSDFELYTRYPSYREFSDKHRFRRKMLIIGSNDGQLHAFDAGRYTRTGSDQIGTFDSGTGTELFSIIPRMVLPIVRDLADGKQQTYAMDGSPRVADVFIDPIHNGTPTAEEREWRSVVIAGMREGGNRFPSRSYVQPRPWKIDDTSAFRGKTGYSMSGYVAVDVTQPDRLRSGNEPRDTLLPDCLRLDGSVASDCGPLPFPAVLWEFLDESVTTGLPFDEDGNSRADLADTWSAPVIRQIAVLDGDKVVVRQVAIFGGGMDAPAKSGAGGNWLYMVDVETGKAIYKRSVIGAVPSSITVQDRDNDARVDTIYFGTTAGMLYKVDVSEPVPLELVFARDVRGTSVQVERVTSELWEPFPIFETGPASAPALDRPIYYAPTAFYVASVGRYALAFGTGDRENLWKAGNVQGRFYVILDKDWTRQNYLDGALPIRETQLVGIDPDVSLAAPPGSDYVLANAGGWYFRLAPEERVTTPGFGLVGLLNFTAFNPVTEVVAGDGSDFCARTGESRLFIVDATNGNGLLTVNNAPARYDTVGDFATPPFLEQGQTGNEGSPTDPPPQGTRTEVTDKIKAMFPESARFANYYYRLVQRTSRNVMMEPIVIPIGITTSNWKEF